VSIASPSTLLLATALASPTLLSAANGTTEIGDAALRFLICVPVAAIMLAVLRMLTRDYGPGMMEQLRRRADDNADGPAPVNGEPPVKQREPTP
jgi:hypothetical protein